MSSCCDDFVPSNGSGGSGGGTPPVDDDAVIFDDAVAADKVNIRSNRASNQSPIDNTLAQITNFGSQDHLQDPAATGATGAGSTIGGGDDNTASADYSTVMGGRANIASDVDATAAGYGNQAIGPQNIAMGAFCIADGPASGDDELGGAVAIGHKCVSSGVHAVSMGTACQALGNAACAMGAQTTASGDHSFAACNSAVASGDDSAAFNRGTASGIRSFAEGGRFNEASGNAAHVEGGTGGAGGICTASGDQSHAGGVGGIASGTGSFAHGGTASGPNSFAGPGSSSATADRSTAMSGGTASGTLSVGLAGSAVGVQSFAGPGALATADRSIAFGIDSAGSGRGALNEGEMCYGNSSINFGKNPKVLASGKIGGGGGGALTTTLKFGASNNKQVFLDDPLNPFENLTFSFRLLVAVSQRQAGVDYSGSIEFGFNIKSLASVATITGTSPIAVYGDAQVAGFTLVPSIGSSAGRPVLVLTLTQGGVVGPSHADAEVEWVQTLIGNF